MNVGLSFFFSQSYCFTVTFCGLIPSAIYKFKKSVCTHIHTQSLGIEHEHKDEEGDLEALPLHLKHDGYGQSCSFNIT
jgi:hypothetical protein